MKGTHTPSYLFKHTCPKPAMHTSTPAVSTAKCQPHQGTRLAATQSRTWRLSDLLGAPWPSGPLMSLPRQLVTRLNTQPTCTVCMPPFTTCMPYQCSGTLVRGPWACSMIIFIAKRSGGGHVPAPGQNDCAGQVSDTDLCTSRGKATRIHVG